MRDEEERVPGRGGLPGGVEAQDLGLRPPGPDQHGQGIGRTEGGLRGRATAERGERAEARLESLPERRRVVQRRADGEDVEASRRHVTRPRV